jgi:hypothetical protein
MRTFIGVFAVAGVMAVFLAVTLWAADWVNNHENGWYE